MSDEPIEPPDADVSAILRADLDVDLMPQAVPERLWQRLDASLVDPTPSPTDTSGADVANAASRGVAGKLALLLTATHLAAVGAGFAGGLWASSTTTSVRAPRETNDVALASDAGRASNDAQSATTAIDGGGNSDPQPVAPPIAPRVHDAGPSRLARERIGIEIARSALGRRQYADALAALEAHEQRFPRSLVAEEREALWIRALLGLGERDGARVRATAFARRYPDSLFLDAIEPALRDEP